MRTVALHVARVPRALLAGALIALFATPASASWPPYGVPFDSGRGIFGEYYVARLYPNADGGVSVAYFGRFGHNQSYPAVEVGQFAADGTPLGGIRGTETSGGDVCAGPLGSVYAVVNYTPNYQPPMQALLERLNGPPGWPAPGLILDLGQYLWPPMQLAPTSGGGCLLAWVRYDTAFAVTATIARSDGTVDPGWPAGGLTLGDFYPHSSDGEVIGVAGDDVGGGYLVWWGGIQSLTNSSINLTRVTANGAIAAGWPAGGLVLGQGSLNRSRPPRMLRLPNGDVLVAWKDGTGDIAPGQFHIHRVRPDGTFAPGWPATGRIVHGAADITSYPEVVADGGDGVYLVWALQNSPGASGSELRATHVLGDGTIAPGWTASGLRVSAPGAMYGATIDNDGYGGHRAYNFRACADESGGVFVEWLDGRGSAPPSDTTLPGGPSAWVAHFTSTGIPGDGWTVDGRMVNDPTLGVPTLGGIAPAPGGGVFVAWTGPALAPQNFALFYVYAWIAKVDPEVPVPTLVSVVSATASDGRVRVTWSLGGGTPPATVYRSADGGAWTRVAALTPDGTGRIVYEDANVSPGTRYGYRLGITEGGAETFAGEAWVEVPRLTLALEGARPNPSPGGGLAAAFTLADGTPARLEALDLAGRRIASAEVGSLGPGRHVVTLAQAVPPGIYLLRLTQAGRAIDRRAAVLP